MRPDILTRSGLYFNLVEPTPEMVRTSDIAHALGMLARFCGHTSAFYSVAQHCVLVSMLVPWEHALQALLHDAAEAYYGEVTAPLKRLVPHYRDLEKRGWRAIAASFGVPEELHPSVKQADLVMLATEQRDLMPPHDDEWAILRGITPLSTPVDPLGPSEATQLWLRRFGEVTGRCVHGVRFPHECKECAYEAPMSEVRHWIDQETVQ